MLTKHISINSLPPIEYDKIEQAKAAVAKLMFGECCGDSYNIRECERQDSSTYFVIECFDRDGFYVGDF